MIHSYQRHKYRDRTHAGEVLAAKLQSYRSKELVVVAIPNGGVPVGAVIARELGAELYLMLVRKLQIPDNPEAGFGSLTYDGFLLLNQPLIRRLGLSEADIANQKDKAFRSLRSRQKFFGKRAEPPPLKGLMVVLVDDGLASGFTMEAAVKSSKAQGAEQITIAAPTASMSAYRHLEGQVDRIVCPDLSRLRIFAVADAYENWYDLDEDEVLRLLGDLPAKDGKTT